MRYHAAILLCAALAGIAAAQNRTDPYAALEAKADVTAIVARARHWTEPFDQTEPSRQPQAWCYFPENARPLRGLLIANTKASVDPRPAMRAMQFGWIFTNWDKGTGGDYLYMMRDGEKFLRPYLRALGQRFDRPELEHLPLCIEGWQGEEEPVWRQLFAAMPEQLLGVTHGWSWRRHPIEFRRTVPYLMLHEPSPGDTVHPFKREPGELFSKAVHFDFPHGMWGKQVMYWMFMDQIVKARVPFDEVVRDKPVALAPMREEDGWLGDADYMAAKGGNWTDRIAPFAAYDGDKSHAVWLPSEYFAWVWRAQCVKNDTPLEIEGPVTRYKRGGPRRNARGETFNCGLGVSRSFAPSEIFDITVELRVGAARVAKVEFHDGNIKLGESTRPPFTLSGVSLPDPGIHALIAVATLTDGSRGASHPAPLVIEGNMYTGTAYGERHHGQGIVAGAHPPIRWWRPQNQLWTAALPAAARSAAVPMSTRLFALCEPNLLVCLDTRSGQTVWAQTLVGNGAGPTPFVTRGAVYTVLGSGHVAAHNFSGRPLWAASVAPGRGMASPVLCGRVLVVQGAKLTGLDSRTGKLLWEVARPDTAPAGPPEKVMIGGEHVAVTGWGAAVRVGDGKVVSGSLPASAPAIAKGIACWCGAKSVALRLPATTGDGAKFEELWSVAGDETVGSPVVWDGLLYSLTPEQELVVRHIATGQTVYRQSLGKGTSPDGNLVALNGRIYAVNLGPNHRTAIVKAGRQFVLEWEYFTAGAAAVPTFLTDRQYVRVGNRVHALGGADPSAPVAPVFVKPAPLAQTPAGAVVTPLVVGEAPAEWLTLGPLNGRDLETDHLASLGGRDKAVPTAGSSIEVAGAKHAFGPVAANQWLKHAHTRDTAVITLITGREKLAVHPSIAGTNFNNTTYLFTIVNNDALRYLRLSIWSPGQFDNRKDLDYRAWLGGQRITEHDVIRLEPGRYAFLIQASVGQTPPWGMGWIRPHLIDAAADGAAVQQRYEAAVARWPAYAIESKQPFTLE